MESHFDSLQTLEGQSWSLDRFRDRVTVVSFTDQKAQEASTKAASSLGKLYMENARFQIVTAVKVPSMFKAMAGTFLKSGQAKARESAIKKFESEGKTAPADLAERIHVVFDLNGKCSGSVLEGWRDGEAQLVVVDAEGSIQAQASNKDGQVAAEELAEKIASLLTA